METGKFPGYRAWEFLRQQNLVVVKTEMFQMKLEFFGYLAWAVLCVVHSVMSPRCVGVV